MRVKLKNMREEKGFSVEDVAMFLNISKSHYYKIESGIRNPNFILADKIAKLFNSNVNDIFFDNKLDEMSKNKTG